MRCKRKGREIYGGLILIIIFTWRGLLNDVAVENDIHIVAAAAVLILEVGAIGDPQFLRGFYLSESFSCIASSPFSPCL